MNCRSPDKPRSLAETLARAEMLAIGRTPFYSGVNRDVVEMANACLLLSAALEHVRETDRTEAYEPGEARPGGAVPPAGECGGVEWRTPRQIADWVLAPDNRKGKQDGQEADTT